MVYLFLESENQIDDLGVPSFWETATFGKGSMRTSPQTATYFRWTTIHHLASWVISTVSSGHCAGTTEPSLFREIDAMFGSSKIFELHLIKRF